VFVLLVLTWLISIVWVVHERSFEPTITSMALLASITALIGDRWIARAENRRAILHALVHELAPCGKLLRDIDKNIADRTEIEGANIGVSRLHGSTTRHRDHAMATWDRLGGRPRRFGGTRGGSGIG
jgi:hypothetical protein